MSKIINDRLHPVWHRMLYSCTRMAAMGVKGLSFVNVEMYVRSSEFCD